MFSDSDARGLISVRVDGSANDSLLADYLAAGLERDGLTVVTDDVARVDAQVVAVDRTTLADGLELLRAARRRSGRCGLVCVSRARDVRLLGPGWDDRPTGTRFVAIPALSETSELTDVVVSSVRSPLSERDPLEVRLPLTDAQLDVLVLIAEGRTNEEIAVARGTSEKAVRGMVGRMARSLELDAAEVNVRVALVRLLLGEEPAASNDAGAAA